MENVVNKKETVFSRFFGKKNKETDSWEMTYQQALLELYVDAYLIINQENNDIIDYNDRMISMFALPPEVDLKKLNLSRMMMRYLAQDSENMVLVMDNIPDFWQGEASFITHNKDKFLPT